MNISQYDISRIGNLLSSMKWTWAKSYINVPHEYIVRGRCGLSDKDFLYIVHAQRDIGVHERWGKYNFPYLYVDGYKYWTMGDTFENTIILNRQKVFNEIDTIDADIAPYYGESTARFAANAFRSICKGSILEIGCGDGKYISLFRVTPDNYLGIEPSQNMCRSFTMNNPNFSSSVLNKAYEECSAKSKKFDITVALFGSASYIMAPYLRILASSGCDYFLMFYKDGFCPECYKSCHHFAYTKEDIKSMFPRCSVTMSNNYIICSSKLVPWSEISKNNT